MRAILVSVDYADLLEVTLPYNRHHFDEMVVVTTLADTTSQTVAIQNEAVLFCTDSFYDDGATFNKWKALEEGLDFFGREGWICLMDADVLWPKVLPPIDWRVGKLYTPLRRMFTDLSKPIPREEYLWPAYKHHRVKAEWSGYSQIFHCDDAVLDDPPWHEIDWKHAGGADSFFQQKWNPEDKIRPPFDVLHLGLAGENWCGRSTPYLDGTQHPESSRRAKQLTEVFRTRRQNRNFDHEKLGASQ